MGCNKYDNFALSGKITEKKEKRESSITFYLLLTEWTIGFGKFRLKEAYKGLGRPFTFAFWEMSEEHYLAMNICSAENRKTLTSIVKLAWNM